MASLEILLLIVACNVVKSCERPSCSGISSDPMEVILATGWEGEEHHVRTEDGYVLTLHRLLPPAARRLAGARARRAPVLLQHGIWSSSFYWLAAGPDNALPFILSKDGYDVWMSNSRGNGMSQEHVSLTTDMGAFWDFSFHEMGKYDLPAVIDYVLNTTGKNQLHYIGHSMGTTMFFVMASLRPDVAAKVRCMVALAPVATVGPIRSFLRIFTLLQRPFLQEHVQNSILARQGISTKTILHYMQLYFTGKFSMYDYGKTANVKMYNTSVAPFYQLSQVSTPVLLCYGTADPFATFKDVDTLKHSLGHAVDMWQFPLNHLEFVEGKRTKRVLFERLLDYVHESDNLDRSDHEVVIWN